MYALAFLVTFGAVLAAILTVLSSNERGLVLLIALPVAFLIAEPVASIIVGDPIAPMGDSIRRLLG